ncbi:MAG: hypothetical protein ABUL71_02395, partial [Gemmatimonadota bacterium]
MRASWIATVPVLAGLVAMPAQGQVSARIHVDIPIGHGGSIGNRRQLMVREYDRGRYGAWESYYDEWIPVTVYFYDGYYYDYPIVPYAEPVIVYRYRDELFLAPRQREFNIWREQYRVQPYRRDYDRFYRPMPRNDRDDRRFPAPRDGRDGRDRDDRYRQGGGQVQPPRDDRGQRGGGQAQPPRDDRGRQGGGQAQPPRDDRGRQGGGQAQPPRDDR